MGDSRVSQLHEVANRERECGPIISDDRGERFVGDRAAHQDGRHLVTQNNFRWSEVQTSVGNDQPINATVEECFHSGLGAWQVLVIRADQQRVPALAQGVLGAREDGRNERAD